ADFDTRKRLHDELRENLGEYRRLNSLRNQIAHGSREKSRDTARAMRDEETLRATLKGLFRALKGRMKA
ncbi:MAG: hypothetical protein R8K47_08520, partial [Mariprofundaceae bacterium]